MRWLVVLALVLTSGCATMKPEDFAGKQPELDLFAYFDGATRAWGVFEDRFGNLRRQFKVEIQGRVEDGRLVLEEDFVYADGETDRRVWRIERFDKGRYLGSADDVLGEAIGHSVGNALNWRYEMDLKVGDGSWRVSFDDWMFLQPDDVLINRATVKKWGLEIGTVTLFFKKEN
jgi:hypothetical protein